MANPNIAALTTIYGKTTGTSLTTTAVTNLLINPAASGVVFKVGTIIAANKSATNAALTLTLVTNVSGLGLPYCLAYAVSIPANAALVLVGRDAPIYLDEDKKLTVTAEAASAEIDVIVSYEEIS